MLPGPDKIVACPHCRGLAKYMTLLSGNTFGAQTWTDGKQVAPMLPRPPQVVKCRHCSRCYWLANAENVGTRDRWGEGRLQGEAQPDPVDPAWDDAEYVEEPTEEQFYASIDGLLASAPTQERSLRILAWWRSNDPYRTRLGSTGDAPDGASGPRRDNLEALAALLDEKDETDLIMKAELFRELGKFEESRGLLGRSKSPELDQVVLQLRSLCNREESRVGVLKFD